MLHFHVIYADLNYKQTGSDISVLTKPSFPVCPGQERTLAVVLVSVCRCVWFPLSCERTVCGMQLAVG